MFPTLGVLLNPAEELKPFYVYNKCEATRGHVRYSRWQTTESKYLAFAFIRETNMMLNISYSRRVTKIMNIIILLLFLQQKGSLYTQSSVIQVIMIIKSQEGIAG